MNTPAELVSDESVRMSIVRRYAILDTPPDGAFDRVTAIAARLLGTPIAIVSIVDTDRIWFKSHHGLEAQQIPRNSGLCASAILQSEPWLVTDAKHDPRTLANPLVAGEFGLQFYLGVPLHTHDGFNLGTLCVLDTQPRTVTQEQIDTLTDLASVVMDQLELRLSAMRSIAEKQAALNHSHLMAEEIDHRVMNSLHLIVSMLSIQSAQLGSSEAAKEISRAATKIFAVANVHQHINVGKAATTLDSADYLVQLCAGLSTMLGRGDQVAISVDAVPLALASEQLSRLGLIVNELVTNALKYGASKVNVKLTPYQQQYCLTVSDNGSGLPANFDVDKMSGLGMKVITSLVRNLGGSLSHERNANLGGTTFQIFFSPMMSSHPPH
ncbi:sensor histidine kinase [Pseudomonas sp. NPDC096950]|uniref:sensor histidine kinase n=1 Tax=Pseudomonas sp. NPDC096950 TaxID=3364485 RepID=UPI00383AD7C3